MAAMTSWWIRGALSVLALTLAFSRPAAPAAQAVRAAIGVQDAVLRPYANGAGPSAFFRAGRTGGRDLFGVVDPVLWRVAFYTLDDPSSAPLTARWRAVGDCALAPTFRVWRVHLLPGAVVLQSQPNIASPARQIFETDQVTVDTRPASLAAIAARAPTDADLAPALPCGPPARFVAARDAGQTVTGGGARAFVVSRRHLRSGAPAFLRRRITLAAAPAVLVSAQELEDARSAGGAPLRHVLLTARSAASPGFARAEVTIVRRGPGPGLDRTLRIDVGLTRVKAGQRFVAVSSFGEVLVVGTADHDSFYLHSCRFPDAPGKAGLCRVESHPSDAGTSPPMVLASHAVTPVSRAQLWGTVAWYMRQSYRIDAAAIPGPCRKVAPCRIGADRLAWSPISQLRLASGVVTRTGVPYAQSQSLDGRPAPGRVIAFPTAGVIPAYISRRGVPWVVSDIENTGVRDNPTKVAVLGIDCSAFVSALWGRTSALGTREFIDEANRGALARVRGMGQARMGDAFVINLAATINHIAVFRESRAAGPYDSSRVVLVAESSSACGGVCWSVYDEGFFDGWAILRNKQPSVPQSGMAPIPISYDGWRRLMATN
jgi:hypothetical protein